MIAQYFIAGVAGIRSKIIIGMFLFLLSTALVFAQQESGQATTGTGTLGPAGKTLTEPIPSNIINKSDDYIKSFVGKDYFDKYLILTGNKSSQSGTGDISYNVLYSYDIPSDYLASPNPKQVSVSLDKDGNIIEYLGPKKPHTFSITKEHTIEIAKQNGLKEPFIAEIDRVLASNSIDGYVWVVTGALDKTTCKDIGGAQECLIKGIYVDVDDGSVMGIFNKSNLIRENQKTSKNASNVSIIALLIIILIIRYKIMNK